jgi:hypothetical protein
MMYRYILRWIPSVISILLFSVMITMAYSWPPSYWMDVKTVQVDNSYVGNEIPMAVRREIYKPFKGTWLVTIRKFEGNWVVWCNATGASNYNEEAHLPKDLTMKWWTSGQCYPLPPGKYQVTTSWSIDTALMLPDKIITTESNIFEVKV